MLRRLLDLTIRSAATDATDAATRVVDRHDERGQAASPGVWRGGSGLGRGPASARSSRRRAEELAYWASELRGKGAGAFEKQFGRWQRTRLAELAAALRESGVSHHAGGDSGFERWAAGMRVLEIGCGPIPCAGFARWKSALAADPLMDAYVSEDLWREASGLVTPVCASGECLPVPAASVDLVICENTLDHVDEPWRVCDEMRRVLAPRGLVWLLVDQMEYRDEMHPHPMSLERVRELFARRGFGERFCEVKESKSHPQAMGQVRVMWERR